MIDWISARLPYLHNKPINNGNFVSFTADNRIEFKTDKYLPVKGSYNSSLSVRSFFDPKLPVNPDSPYNCLDFSGNPVKYLQGHNIWGSGDLQSILFEAIKGIFKTLELDNFSVFTVLNARLTRVDVTAMYLLESPERVNNWLFSAEKSASLKHRGRGLFKHGTLYFGSKSTYWTLKFYHKGDEIMANKKHQRSDIYSNEDVLNFASRSLRSEVMIRSRELQKTGLDIVSKWSKEVTQKVYNRYISRLELSENTMIITDEKLMEIPNHFRRTYFTWRAGMDVREGISRQTFYKHRRYLMDSLGIDISIKQDSLLPDTSNVIPLIQVIEAKPASVPDFALGTDLYFEPKKVSV